MSLEEDLSLKNEPQSKNRKSSSPTVTAHKPVEAIKDLIKPGMSNEELVNTLVGLSPDVFIPWEMCTLPSQGRFYKDQFGNAWPDGIVQVRAMTQTAEKVLATDRLAQSGQAIDYLLRECVKLPDGFDPVDLLITDRTFLLYYIRGITHGNMYEFAVECPNDDCKKKSIHEYDLNLLANTIRVPDVTLGEEPFKVVLPYASELAGKDVWVSVRMLRGIDIQNMVNRRKLKQRTIVRPGRENNPFNRKMQESQEKVTLDQSLTEIMEKNIVNVMGITTPHIVQSFIARMHARDSGTVREFLRENTPGIDTTVSITCTHCGNDITVEIPISEQFFRPSVKR